MNRTAAEIIAQEIALEVPVYAEIRDRHKPAQSFMEIVRRVADIIERACGQNCADCDKPLGQTFKVDEDERRFHHSCGGAEFAKRMAALPGTPEFNRLRACGHEESNAKLDKLRPFVGALESLVQVCENGWIKPKDKPTDWVLGWAAACKKFKTCQAQGLAKQTIRERASRQIRTRGVDLRRKRRSLDTS